MGVFDKAKQQAEQLVGQAKEALGKATGNDEVKRAGQRDKIEGEVKETGQDIKDRAAGAVDEAKDRLRKDDDS
ncbi:CsbD family protein [Saccharopolyspora oryzae]|uniref:CsbD family protein n=1 Tax=Saccharopolyspora oryzae TaxID=2997343 RepID=A0ABT4V8F6_9PSEU|nr:CsbD family protein [Saccharopolyspora oryzae]MDA3630235.1 CsbD family protein [Saccharopolyspora oryzae]